MILRRSPVRPLATRVALALLVVAAPAIVSVAGCAKKDDKAAGAAPLASTSASALMPAKPLDSSVIPAGSANPFQVMNQALAAAQAASKGATPCERGFNGVIAFVTELERLAPRGANKATPPDREKFLAGCAALPLELQQCLDMSYGLSHQADCQAQQKKLDPATLAKVRQLMGK